LTESFFAKAFNEELDGMFQDVNLPESEAWHAMINDLRKTKDEWSTLSKENSWVLFSETWKFINIDFYWNKITQMKFTAGSTSK
jgi:hypothetical protein